LPYRGCERTYDEDVGAERPGDRVGVAVRGAPFLEPRAELGVLEVREEAEKRAGARRSGQLADLLKTRDNQESDPALREVRAHDRGERSSRGAIQGEVGERVHWDWTNLRPAPL
jgi:hypothetical protein